MKISKIVGDSVYPVRFRMFSALFEMVRHYIYFFKSARMNKVKPYFEVGCMFGLRTFLMKRCRGAASKLSLVSVAAARDPTAGFVGRSLETGLCLARNIDVVEWCRREPCYVRVEGHPG